MLSLCERGKNAQRHVILLCVNRRIKEVVELRPERERSRLLVSCRALAPLSPRGWRPISSNLEHVALFSEMHADEKPRDNRIVITTSMAAPNIMP